MAFLIKLMFSRLDKFDGPIFEVVYIRGGGGLRLRMVIRLHIWRWVYIRGGACIWGAY